jgi:hypothetical protein
VRTAIAQQLTRHGVQIDELSAPAAVKVERFAVDTVRQAERVFQSHRETAVSGRYEEASVEAPAGSLVVRTGQRLGALVFYLLEPESDDGLTTWNGVDAALSPGAAHPILKVLPGQRLQTRPHP